MGFLDFRGTSLVIQIRGPYGGCSVDLKPLKCGMRSLKALGEQYHSLYFDILKLLNTLLGAYLLGTHQNVIYDFQACLL